MPDTSYSCSEGMGMGANKASLIQQKSSPSCPAEDPTETTKSRSRQQTKILKLLLDVETNNPFSSTVPGVKSAVFSCPFISIIRSSIVDRQSSIPFPPLSVFFNLQSSIDNRQSLFPLSRIVFPAKPPGFPEVTAQQLTAIPQSSKSILLSLIKGAVYDIQEHRDPHPLPEMEIRFLPQFLSPKC